ncbi:Acyl-CoA N-acyltransferase [Trinorchestia longiramus]|nr:Acyl-CoA N-acyltransferase [Trinorchestia longiramus]
MVPTMREEAMGTGAEHLRALSSGRSQRNFLVCQPSSSQSRALVSNRSCFLVGSYAVTMADCKLPLLADKEVQESITNIDLWLATHSHSGLHAIRAEDLAVAIPGECFFMELLQENEEAHRELEKGILVYTDAREEQYLWLKGDWHPLERILNITSNKEGWHQTQSLGERLLVLVLTQLDYRAREAEGEVPYGCCSPTHPTYLLWVHHRLAGMASIRRKGSSIWGGEEVYACDTLDTVYVRPSHRRHGYTLALLSTLAARLPPGEHLGLSHPISLSMCKVLLKFIQVCPDLRERLWTLDEDGEVSGTVMLMLGSLIMRGALCPPQPPVPQPHPTPSTTASPPPPHSTKPTPMCTNNNTSSTPMMCSNMNTNSCSQSTGAVTHMVTSEYDRFPGTPARGDGGADGSCVVDDKDEPCDTS